jgi:hypothetical protein
VLRRLTITTRGAPVAVIDKLTDAAIAAGAGFAGTKAMEQFNMKTYQLESEEDREREEAVRPGPPPRMAAEKLSSRVLGIELDEAQAMKAGMVFHQLTGLSWTPVYVLLRRRLGWSPVAAGLATGASMSVILDEIITRRSQRRHPTPSTPPPHTSGRSSPTSCTGSPSQA